VYAQRLGNVAKIGRYRNFDAVRAQRVADRIGGIMRNGEARNVEISDREAAPGLKGFERRLVFAPLDIGRGAVREIYGNRTAAGFRQGRQTADVIVMLVRDENGVERGDIFPDGGEALRDLAAAEAGIDKNARAIRRDKRRVTGAAAGENANLDDDDPVLISLFG
jgi:hypothetical protein